MEAGGTRGHICPAPQSEARDDGCRPRAAARMPRHRSAQLACGLNKGMEAAGIEPADKFDRARRTVTV
jgi:hypothetical protein